MLETRHLGDGLATSPPPEECTQRKKSKKVAYRNSRDTGLLDDPRPETATAAVMKWYQEQRPSTERHKSCVSFAGITQLEE